MQEYYCLITILQASVVYPHPNMSACLCLSELEPLPVGACLRASIVCSGVNKVNCLCQWAAPQVWVTSGREGTEVLQNP